jgi:hypothetical protein
VFLKNVTLSVDDEVLAAVRQYAAERNSSVNALVREFPNNLAEHWNRASHARTRLRQLSRQSQGQLGKRMWTRKICMNDKVFVSREWFVAGIRQGRGW